MSAAFADDGDYGGMRYRSPESYDRVRLFRKLSYFACDYISRADRMFRGAIAEESTTVSCIKALLKGFDYVTRQNIARKTSA